jgi:hypothetical protein
LWVGKEKEKEKEKRKRERRKRKREISESLVPRIPHCPAAQLEAASFLA